MSILLAILALIVGIILGRIYGWMKYHYPEFQEQVKLKAARYRAERASYEAEEERYRGEIDEELNRRLGARNE